MVRIAVVDNKEGDTTGSHIVVDSTPVAIVALGCVFVRLVP